MTRKEALKSLTVGTAGLALGASCNESSASSKKEKDDDSMVLKGNINHSACRWCYSKIPLEELIDSMKDMGLKAIDLLQPEEWKVALDRDVAVSMSFGSSLGIGKGFNDPQYHEQLLKDYEKIFQQAEDMGVKNIICFSGNRNGISDQEGLENCAVGLEPVAKLAEKHNVNLIMELLNSKRNHPDYQCDKTPWGVALVDKVGSENFKLLYDIYHMQIMEGDVIDTIKEFHPYFAHYHTGGVPGRHEIDETQELYYPAIMKAILETGYTGYVAQEFVPAGPEPLASLKAAVKVCDV
ncbi:MAG: TIM barrel protein [Bacteroidetes bacterium]|nr:TIM barrel protein [Bacteroidota bacterium]MCB0852748.1 TIM barrel protein [Bacteroidota bacterium]